MTRDESSRSPQPRLSAECRAFLRHPPTETADLDAAARRHLGSCAFCAARAQAPVDGTRARRTLPINRVTHCRPGEPTGISKAQPHAQFPGRSIIAFFHSAGMERTRPEPTRKK